MKLPTKPLSLPLLTLVFMAGFFSSSIGKKFIMSITGLFLMLFLLVHLAANITGLFGAESFNRVCRFMSTNPIILAMVPVLAAGFVLHILYGLLLNLSNLKARGRKAYAVPHKGPVVSWASTNMFVLGCIILGGLVLHLFHFWARMQLQEFMGGAGAPPYDLLVYTFSKLHTVIIYIVWIIALWFHLTHGFWSAFQSLGLSNKKWISRWQIIAYVYATVVAVGFISIPLYFYLFVG